MDKEIRWKQRFANYEKAYRTLSKYIDTELDSELEKAGLIQFFEMTFELSWKVMKDFLENQGYDVKGPRDAIKLAFQIDLINNGHIWLDALEERNMTVHTYDEHLADKMISHIKGFYYPELKAFFVKFKKE